MSDFDDEPEEGLEATDEPGGADDEVVTTAKPAKKARPQPAADDDWDDDDWDDDDGGNGGKRDLTLVYAIVAAAIVIVLAVVLTRPSDNKGTGSDGGNNSAATATTEAVAPSKNWQGPVGDAVGENGKEAQKRAEGAPGVYIWTDFGGWHLRANGSDPVTVKVTADQVRAKKTDDRDDGNEDASAPFAAEATVTLPAGDGSEGIGIDLGNSESATFTVTVGGTNVAADTIFLGGAEGVADQNPVTFVKS